MLRHHNLGYRSLLLAVCFAVGACDDDGTVLDSDVAETGSDIDPEESPCHGLESPECEGTEGCYEVWGNPIVQHPDTGQWCLEPNGTTFLGCADVGTCTDLPGTLCADVVFDVINECHLPDLDSCEPPAVDLSFCS